MKGAGSGTSPIQSSRVTFSLLIMVSNRSASVLLTPFLVCFYLAAFVSVRARLNVIYHHHKCTQNGLPCLLNHSVANYSVFEPY